MGDMTSPTDIDDLELLAALQQDFHTHLASARDDSPVPACGSWTVRDLAEHLAGVYVWAAGMARGEKVPRPEGHVEDLAAHYRDCAAHLHRTLTEVGPDAPARIFGGEGAASFWRRRQLHETLVHLHDLAEALSAPAPQVPPAVWADGVDEIVHVMHPRQVRLDRAKAPSATLLLMAEDTQRHWTFPAAAETSSSTDTSTDTDGPAAELRGRADDLVLLLWGRRRLEDSPVEVSGDHAAVQDVLAQAITP